MRQMRFGPSGPAAILTTVGQYIGTWDGVAVANTQQIVCGFRPKKIQIIGSETISTGFQFAKADVAFLSGFRVYLQTSAAFSVVGDDPAVVGVRIDDLGFTVAGLANLRPSPTYPDVFVWTAEE